MKNTVLFFSLLFMSCRLIGQNKVTKIPMQKEHWEYTDGKVEFINHRSSEAIKLLEKGVSITPKDINFKTGTIEFDVETVAGPFVGINFRKQNEQEMERLYLRPYRAGNPMGEDAVQYAPILKGVNLWDMLGAYQGSAVINAEGWNHVKMVISEQQMRVFINDMQHAALEIPKLEGNTSEGSIVLYGNAIFANFTLHPNEIGNLPNKAGADPTSHDPRYLRNWLHTTPILFPSGRDVVGKDMPIEETKWQEISAERLGLVNLPRLYGRAENNERRLIWLKTIIQSDRQQERRIDLGFSDEVWVFINGQFLHIDKNFYVNAIRKEPDGRCDLSNTSFTVPLNEGDNELLIGVSNFFFGWGIMARLDDVEGILFK